MIVPAKPSARANRCGVLAAAIVATAILAAVTSPAPAQPDTGTSVPNALQGFSENKGQPIEIESSRLEVRDKQGVATFTGSVKVVQGDTTMRCQVLTVFYERQPGAAGTAKAATPGPGGSQQISKMEARGGVTVTQKDNTAAGDTALFDMRSNTATLIGNVVVSQGPNVIRGDRLVVNMTTGVSRVDASKSHGPVRMLIQQRPQTSDGQSNASPLPVPSRPFQSN
jgi:lipopolysaccharide export system protein LptA